MAFDTWPPVGNPSTLEGDYLQRHGDFTAAGSGEAAREYRAAG
jgi:hypothetical protein